MIIFILIFAATTTQAREINRRYLKIGLIKYGKTVEHISKQNNIDYLLVVALICYENHTWNAKAKSSTGDLGLMQIHSNDTSFLNAGKNLKYGIKKLANLIKKFGFVDGIEAYNKGSAGMRRIKTRIYAKEIIKFYHKLKERK